MQVGLMRILTSLLYPCQLYSVIEGCLASYGICLLKCKETGNTGNLTLCSFYKQGPYHGRTICNHNSMAPRPHAGHPLGHTPLWDCISILNHSLSVTLPPTAHPR
ncbi:hypothetical protein CHARACLAT_029350 [Characodon lateralis]|uniref:Secreted protein n=1 Tax=Characodon lateralis TaxID=208331 RepID=A0ABU7ENA9_9TELE|nr:hypothetical protein [Characodon lateralis]